MDLRGRTPFDREKFKELILLVAQKSANDPRFGATKLNKLLFWCDFIAYAHLGRSMTGARYQKLERGPAPRALPPVHRELVEDREAAESASGRYIPRRTVALRDPDLSRFSRDELELIDEVIEAAWEDGAVDVSELSHRFLGWQLVDLYEDIPYEAMFVKTSKPEPAVMEGAAKVAQQLGFGP